MWLVHSVKFVHLTQARLSVGLLAFILVGGGQGYLE